MAGTPAEAPKVPGWISVGQIVTAIGALLILIGFIFGELAVSNLATSATSQGNASNYQGDLEAFFILVGFGILLAIGGWLMDSIWPKFKARPRPMPTYAPAPPAPAPAGMAPGTPPPPAAAPAAPNCARCGKPTTYIAQYGRYYCYTDNLYV